MHQLRSVASDQLVVRVAGVAVVIVVVVAHAARDGVDAKSAPDPNLIRR